VDNFIPKDHGFPKDERIRKKRDFEKVFSYGRRIRDKYFLIICHKSGLGKQRVAIVVGKRYGNAYLRNKIKRKMREIYRMNKEKFPLSTDCIIIPHKSVLSLSFQEIKEDLLHLLKKAYE